jgi:hypothetical protein
MPFPPTPSQTPSNTPTPSITPSNTPSYTPTGTVCPELTPTPTTIPCVCFSSITYSWSGVPSIQPIIVVEYCNGRTPSIFSPPTGGSGIRTRTTDCTINGGFTSYSASTYITSVTLNGCCGPDVTNLPTPTPTVTPTNTNTQTQTPTNTSTQTPTPTSTISCYTCQQFYNNSFDTQTVNYRDCDGTFYYDFEIEVGEFICIRPGTLSGPGADNLDYVFDCGGTCPTPTPTNTQTPTELSCQCYRIDNNTEGGLDVTYTPCGSIETTVTVPGNNAINICVEPLTTIYRDPGLEFPIFCGINCINDSECTVC